MYRKNRQQRMLKTTTGIAAQTLITAAGGEADRRGCTMKGALPARRANMSGGTFKVPNLPQPCLESDADDMTMVVACWKMYSNFNTGK